MGLNWGCVVALALLGWVWGLLLVALWAVLS